jgi:hypothetical protein
MKRHLPKATLGTLAAGALLVAAGGAEARELNWTSAADSSSSNFGFCPGLVGSSRLFGQG